MEKLRTSLGNEETKVLDLQKVTFILVFVFVFTLLGAQQ
jgi:hypothetical protein